MGGWLDPDPEHINVQKNARAKEFCVKKLINGTFFHQVFFTFFFILLHNFFFIFNLITSQKILIIFNFIVSVS